MKLFSEQHEYRIGSDSQMDKYFAQLKQFVKEFKGSEPKYYYFQQGENGDKDTSSWRFGTSFNTNGKKVQIVQPTGKDWKEKFKFRVDGSSWTEGNKISTVEGIEAIASSRKPINSSRTALETFQIVKDVCTEYGIKVPEKIMDPFYQDLVLAIIPDFLGETEMRRRQDRINKYEDNMRRYGYSDEGKYRFASRQIKSEVQTYEVNFEYDDVNGQIVKAVDKVSAESEEEAEQIAIEAYRNNKGTRDTMVGDIRPYLVKPVQSSRKSIKNSVDMDVARRIRAEAKVSLKKYGAEFSEPTIETIDGDTYVVFKYYGGTNDTIDRNDDSWDEIYAMDGVVDVGYGSGYGFDNTRWEDSLLIQIEDSDELNNSRKIKSAKEECGADACVLTPFGEIDRTVANADFTDESFEAYVVEPYAEESDGQFVIELETKGDGNE